MSSVDERPGVAAETGEALSAVLAARLGEFDGVDLGGLDGRELAERLQELERQSRQLEHAIVEVVGEADRRGSWSEDGHRSVRCAGRVWCQATVNWSGAETTHRVRSVKLLTDLPAVADALAGGDVGVAQVRELAGARANPRCGDQLADCADILLDNAKAMPFDDFRLVVQRWEALADTDGAHRDHEAAHAGRKASIDPVGNGHTIRGDCGVVQGAAMREILDRFAEAEFQADWDEARNRLGADADITPSDLVRTTAQRRMDALHAIFMTAAAAEPGGKAPEPVVNIVVDHDIFEAAMSAMATGTPLGDWMPPVTDPRRRRCETIDGVLVDPYHAVVAALVGPVRRVVFDSASRVINLGTTSRIFRGASRLAVWLQGGTRCRWPGCGRHHCQIDHSRPWSAHGLTDLDNADPLCGYHNVFKTCGYHTWRDPDGHWHLHRPDGTEIRPI